VQDWPAGRRLSILETRPADPATSPSHAWYRVRLENSLKDPAPPEGWLPDVYLCEPPPVVAPDSARAIGREIIDRTHGLPPEYAPEDLVAVGPGYDKDVKYQLRREAATALKALVAAARQDGVKLQVVSAYRTWAKQQELYEHRLRESGWEQTTVAPPGHSEHQLGTAVDLTGDDDAALLQEGFGASPAGRWLRAHAPEHGFALSFTTHNAPITGFAPEPWHYRYWGPAQARARHQTALGEK
jgi:zinc D-Ala-D-Ala carboxypeptidase